jgi:predicted metal-dependent enzyme (double-stranded beta helix superfamily)
MVDRFDIDAFVGDCRRAIGDADAHGALQDVVERAVARGPALAEEVPPSLREAGGLIHYSPELTVLWLEWPPGMTDPPHDHGVWAAVGVYAGEESSVVYRRTESGIEPVGTQSLTDGEAVLLGADIIHAVSNPRDRWTGSLHVYAGDFLSPARREWDLEALAERAWDPVRSLDRYTAAVAAHTA